MNDFIVKFVTNLTATVHADRFIVDSNGCLLFYVTSKPTEEPILIRAFNRDVWCDVGWL